MKFTKHLIAVALIMAFTCAQANAFFRFGVKAGLNVDKMHFNEQTFDATNRCGFTAGVMTEFTVPIIGIGADLSVMFTRMNSRPYQIVNTIEEKASVGRNFLEIPLNLKYKLNIPVVASIIKPMIYTGPTLALKLAKNDNFTQTKTAQWGWNLGIGLELINHLQIAGGYTFGINNIAKHFADVTNVKVRNNYWTVTAAWLF